MLFKLAGEVAQSVQYLQRKHEELNLSPSIDMKTQARLRIFMITVLEMWRQDAALGSLVRQPNLTGQS